MDNHFTHVDAAGNARMVDVGEKAVTHRTAVAVGRVTMSPECFAAVAEGRAKRAMCWAWRRWLASWPPSAPAT